MPFEICKLNLSLLWLSMIYSVFHSAVSFFSNKGKDFVNAIQISSEVILFKWFGQKITIKCSSKFTNELCPREHFSFVLAFVCLSVFEPSFKFRLFGAFANQ